MMISRRLIPLAVLVAAAPLANAEWMFRGTPNNWGSYAQKWVNDDILVFERRSGTDTAVVAINRGAQQQITVSALGLANGIYNNLVGTGSVSVNNGSAVIDLPQNGIVVLH